jgi:hypothetical protein
MPAHAAQCSRPSGPTLPYALARPPFVRACACQRAIAGGVASSPFRYRLTLWLGGLRGHQLATHSPTTGGFAFFSASVRIRPFCGAGPASPAFRLVYPHAPPLPFLPTATSSLLTTTPPAPLSLFNNRSWLPSSSTLPDLRRQQVA